MLRGAVVRIGIGLATVVAAGAMALAAEPVERITVKFSDEARVRLRTDGLVSLAGQDLSGVRHALAAARARVERLFPRDEDAIDRDLALASRRSGRRLADLNAYYEIAVFASSAGALAEALRSLDVVETAYRSPDPAPPPGDVPPPTPDFTPQQGYLDPAPGGIDAREAWTLPGGRGEGIYLVDVEYDWRDTHEDLGASLGRKVCWTPKGSWIDHGTAVLGELISGDGGYGVTGIAHGASVGMATQDPIGMSNSVARAIDCAASLQQAGDVMLLEAQTTGPHGTYVPVEWNQAEYDAIAAATAKGIVVVEAAGNGNEDLDGAAFLGKFDRNVRDSGAIVVGAGATPASSQPDRSRLSFSTYGSRVDVQGWGERVTSSGYGGLFDGGGDPNQSYTSTFSGTSSASPIVAGAVVALEGVQKAKGRLPLSPLEARRILTDTGTPQQDGPYAGHIGPRPDLRRALAELGDLYVVAAVVDDAPPLGNSDAVLDPGETATIRVTLKNQGGEAATGVHGALAAEQEALARVTDHRADWPDLAPGASAETLAPHFRLTVEPAAACGTVLRFRLLASSVPYADDGAIALDVGQTRAAYPSANVPLTIPKNSSTGVTSTLAVPGAFTIADAQCAVDIAHGDIGELRVVLRSPSGTAVTLHDHGSAGAADIQTTYDRETAPSGPGTMNDFDGEASQGTWSLQVVDDQSGSTPPGTLRAWSVDLTATAPFRCNPLSCADLTPGAVGETLRLDPSGSADLLLSWDPIADAARYRVWRSPSPEMTGSVLVGETAETTLVEAGGRTDPGSPVYYHVRAVNSCEWEGP